MFCEASLSQLKGARAGVTQSSLRRGGCHAFQEKTNQLRLALCPRRLGLGGSKGAGEEARLRADMQVGRLPQNPERRCLAFRLQPGLAEKWPMRIFFLSGISPPCSNYFRAGSIQADDY